MHFPGDSKQQGMLPRSPGAESRGVVTALPVARIKPNTSKTDGIHGSDTRLGSTLLGYPKSRETTSYNSWRVPVSKLPGSSIARNETSLNSKQRGMVDDTTGKINPGSRRNSLEKLLTFQPTFHDRQLRQLNNKLFRAIDSNAPGPHIKTLPFKFFSGAVNGPI